MCLNFLEDVKADIDKGDRNIAFICLFIFLKSCDITHTLKSAVLLRAKML